MPSPTETVHLTYGQIDGLGKQVAPAVAGSTVAVANPFPFACLVRVVGGTVTVIAAGGATQAAASPALVLVDVNESITLTYSVAPTWTWFGIPGR